jgi:hypothetical protein
MGRRSLLGLFARSSRSESEHTARKETAARVGAGVLGAAALAALFLGVRHYQGRSLASLLAILRDVTIDEETKRKALLAASPEDHASVLTDLPAFATLVTGYTASTTTQICDVLCLVPESASGLQHNQRRSILGCQGCCDPQEFGTIEIEQAQVQNRPRVAAAGLEQSHPSMSVRLLDDLAPRMARPAEFTEPELVRRVRANEKGSGAALAHVLNAHGCVGAPQRIVDLLIVPTKEHTQVTAALCGIGDKKREISVRLEAIVPIFEGASVDDIPKFRKYNLQIGDKYDYKELHNRLVRDDQCLVAGFMAERLRAVNKTFIPVADAKATLGERIRYATGRYDERHSITADKALCDEIRKSREKLSDMDTLRAHCILRAGTAIPFDARLLEKRYTGSEHVLIMIEMYQDPHVKDAVLKSARFMRGLVHATKHAFAWLPATALTELDDLSVRAVRFALKRDPEGVAVALWAHIQTLVPKGAPTASVLEVLAAGIWRNLELNETTKRSLAGSVARWPVSFHTQASIAAVLGSGQLTCENAPAIVDCAIQAERGGFTKAARAMCTFAGQAAVTQKMEALLAHKPPNPDIVHLAIGAALAPIVDAVRSAPTLMQLVFGKARRNEAGGSSTHAATFLRRIVTETQFGALYTE